jgi:hypothetical protein
MTRSNRLRTLLPAAALAAFAVATPAAVQAGAQGVSVHFDSPVVPIVVHNDGQHFTYAEPKEMKYGLTVHAHCDSHHDLSAFAATPATNEAWVYAWVSHEAQTSRGAALLDVPLDKLFRPPFKHNPVQLCNEELARRVANGSVKSQLLSSGFVLPYPQTVGLAAKCFDKGDVGEAVPNPPEPNTDDWRNWTSASEQRIGTIVCQGHNVLKAPGPPSPPTPVGGVAVPFQVRKVALSTYPTQQTTHCPVTLTFTGSIGVVGKGTVKYRVNHNGQRGPVKTLSFTGTEAKGVSFHIQIKPTPPDQDQGTANPGTGNLAANPVPQNQHDGFAQLEIVSPAAGVRHSQAANYQVNCINPGPQGGPGGLASPRSPVATPHARSSKPKEIVVVGSKIRVALQPDLTSQHGIDVGGRFCPWGGTISLSAARAISKAGGACVFRYDYDAENLGTAPGGPFASRLHDGAALLAETKNLSLAAGATRHVGGHLRLKPGAHLVSVFLDEAQQVAESNETNNRRRVRVIVKGDCGAGKGGR